MQYLPPISKLGEIGDGPHPHDAHVHEWRTYSAWVETFERMEAEGLGEDADPPLAFPFSARWELIIRPHFAGWATDLTETWEEDTPPWMGTHTDFRAYRTRLACFPMSTYIHVMMREKCTPHRAAHTSALIADGLCWPVKNQMDGLAELVDKHYLCLETLDMACDFLRFVLWSVCPNGAPVQILDGNASIQFGLEMVSALQFPTISGTLQDDEWTLDAHVLEKGKIYPAKFWIKLDTGNVSYDTGDMAQDLSRQIPKWQIEPFVKYLVEA